MILIIRPPETRSPIFKETLTRRNYTEELSLIGIISIELYNTLLLSALTLILLTLEPVQRSDQNK